MCSVAETAPADEFIPSPEDEAWACRAFNADPGPTPYTPDELLGDPGDTGIWPAPVIPAEDLPPRARPDGSESVNCECRPGPAASGAPRTLREVIDDEARAYRAWRTPAGDLLADTLDRLSQLLAWTGATIPQDHADRMDCWDTEIQARYYDRGYHEGYEAARRAFGTRPYN